MFVFWSHFEKYFFVFSFLVGLEITRDFFVYFLAVARDFYEYLHFSEI